MSNIEGLQDVEKQDVLTYLNTIFDKPVLLIWPLGVKGTERRWRHITYEMTQDAGYKQDLARAAARGGNIGVVLGPASDNLVTFDFDSDEDRDRFFEWAPWAKETLISVGAKGCQCWFYIDGQYPNKYATWRDKKGSKVLEFRTNVQSIIWGKHPDTKGRYTNNGKEPLHLPYYELKEYHDYIGGTEDEGVWRPGQQGDYGWTKKYKGCDLHDLDLLGMLKQGGVRYEQVEDTDEARRYAIRCPWIDGHTTSNGPRDAMVHVFEPRGNWWPAFTCFHAHCADRGIKDLLGWLEEKHGLGPSVVQKYCSGGRTAKRIEVVDYSELIEAPPLPEPIIDGLLYPELKMMISSSSKIGKTWLGIDLALSIAAGMPWLGFDTCQSRVLYLNTEMPVPWFLKRISAVRRGKEIVELSKGSFKGANLCGSRIFAHEVDPKTVTLDLDPLYSVWKEQPFDVLIMDPIYKLLAIGGLDENKAMDVAKFLGMIDDFGRATKVASVLIHHYAKGNPWDKKAGDRASGSGVFLRDPDTFITITELGSEGSRQARVDCFLRCSPPVDSFGIRWELNNYQWQRDPSIELKKKDKEGKQDKPKANKRDQMIQILKDNPNGLAYGQWQRMVVLRGISEEGYFQRAVNIMRSENRFKQVKDLYFAV